jgi:mRNA guanylyltransferase
MSSYYVCEKSDGMRYLLYLTKDDEGDECHYLIDRKNDYWYVPKFGLHFPFPPPDDNESHSDTLIDGELVFDKVNGVTQPKYLVFDCMVLDRVPLMNRTLDKRIAYFESKVFKPYKECLEKYPEEKQYMHFFVGLKRMEFSYGIEMMFRQILPSLPHGNDGLIFTCVRTEYKHGTDPHIMKWKPEAENSIDFRLSLDFPLVDPDEVDLADGITKPYVDYDALPTCNLFAWNGDNQEDSWYATMFIEPKEWDELKALQQPLDDRIVECFMDAQKRWRYMRFRDDKDHANHMSTVESVIESITDRVTEKDLIVAAKGIRDEWKKREAEAQSRQKKEAERKRVASVGVNGPVKGPVNGGTKRKADEQG